MNDSQKVILMVCGIMDGMNKVGRPDREWVDDLRDWYRASLQEPSHCVQDRTKRNKIMMSQITLDAEPKVNPFNTSCSILLLFEGFSAILV